MQNAIGKIGAYTIYTEQDGTRRFIGIDNFDAEAHIILAVLTGAMPMHEQQTVVRDEHYCTLALHDQRATDRLRQLSFILDMLLVHHTLDQAAADLADINARMNHAQL
jgi:hypothetical protein